jgi:uncharacterized protein (TIGR00266 family)
LKHGLEEVSVEYAIEGKLAQVVSLCFDEGETCWASKGALVAHDPGIAWELKVPGGISGAARRSLSGESVSLTRVTASKKGQKVVLSSNQPGKIIDWRLEEGAVATTRGSFVGAFGPNVDINVIVARRAGAAFFGGAGLFLQEISGRGMAFIHGAGDFLDYRLESGESLLVSTGNLAAFAASVDYSIQSVSGCRRIFFGGEGLFMTRLTGPGRVLLQSLKRTTSTSPGRG